MRILLLTDRFPPEIRSAAHLFHELAVALEQRGHQVAVVTKAPARYVGDGYAQACPLGWSDEAGIATFRTRGFPVAGFHPILRGLDHLTLGYTMYRGACRWPSADVVLVYSPPLPLAMAGARYARRFGATMVLNVQDIYPQTAIDLGLLRNRLAIAASERLERQAYTSAARIVVHSEGNRDFLCGRKGVPAGKVAVIHNWTDTDRLRPGPRDNGFRGEHGLGGHFIVSYAGVMGFAQDLGPVIDAAGGVQQHDDIVFLLVGEGVLEPRWKAMAAARGLRNVRFLPLLPKERYADLLAASDVCLVPLAASVRTPVVPGKMQSIMAAGRPIVAIVPPGGDAPRLLQESGAGVALDPGDSAGLTAAILRLRSDRDLALAMGRRGRAFAEARFSLAAAADSYEALFREVRAAACERPGERGEVNGATI